MSSLPPLDTKYILLADDDEDDCFLFKHLLEELPLSFHLTTVPNGEALMQLLNQENKRLPDVLFLDINMPRKNGIECLEEIKRNEKLQQIPVIIFSSSCPTAVVEQLYKMGAQYCVRKPDDVIQYKKVIFHALNLKNNPISS